MGLEVEALGYKVILSVTSDTFLDTFLRDLRSTAYTYCAVVSAVHTST